MISLFRGIRIEVFFDQLERTIANEIDSFSDHHLLSLNIDDTTNKLILKHKIVVPSLDKPLISNSISEEQVSGDQLPSGTAFHPGTIYKIEVVHYSIPFDGDGRFFEYCPTIFTGATLDANIDPPHLIISLTRYCKITGNNEIIEQIKNELIRKIEIIEQNLNYLITDVQRFSPILESKIKSYLTKKIKHVTTKNDSSDQLNPFK